MQRRNDLRIIETGAAIGASPLTPPPPTIDDMLQHFLSAAQAHARRSMKSRVCKRPDGCVVTHITMNDTGKTVLVTVERANRLVRVLELK